MTQEQETKPKKPKTDAQREARRLQKARARKRKARAASLPYGPQPQKKPKTEAQREAIRRRKRKARARAALAAGEAAKARWAPKIPTGRLEELWTRAEKALAQKEADAFSRARRYVKLFWDGFHQREQQEEAFPGSVALNWDKFNVLELATSMEDLIKAAEKIPKGSSPQTRG